MRFYQLARKDDKGFHYNKERMQQTLDILFNGNYLISFQRLNPQSDIKAYRGCYFAKIDALREDAGETRYAIHEMIKDNILVDMLENMPGIFTHDEASTKYLTEEGWGILLERLDLWAFTEYNIILQ